MIKRTGRTKGFTLVELILVIGVFSIVFSSGAVVFGNLMQKNSLNYHGYRLVQTLREARANAVSQKKDSAWGIYFDHLAPSYSYTLFKGESYVGRDPSFDLTAELPPVVVISQFDIGGLDELVFGQGDGVPLNSGSLTLAAENDSYPIFINSLGLTDFDS